MEQKSEIALKIAEATATAKGGFFSTIIGSTMLFFSNLTVAETIGLVMAAVGHCGAGAQPVACLAYEQNRGTHRDCKARYYESKIKREMGSAASMWSEL